MTWSAPVRLYRQMIRESKRFPNYMFRTYALRRVRDGFREHSDVREPKVIEALMRDAEKNLQIIKRQASIGKMYSESEWTIEQITSKR